MTQPQAREPGAIDLDPRHLLNARKQRIEGLTEENDMLVALNSQLIEEMRRLEDENERLRNKEGDGAEPPAAEGPPNPTQAGHDEQRSSNGRRGPSPADVARRARTQGDQ